MNSKQKKLKNNKKLRIFILFLSVSLLFWMLIKLSGEYTGNANVKLEYIDLPKNKLLQVDPINEVQVTLKAIGFNLFKHKITSKKIQVSLSNIKRKKGTVYYYKSSHIIDAVSDKFSKAEVLSIKPDTLYFNLGKSISKKLKVVPNVKITYQTGFNLSGNLQIEPNEITISGPKAQVDSIFTITTKPLELNNVHESIDKELSLNIDKKFRKVNYSSNKVNIKGEVEKFTERTITSKFKIINVPKAYKITTFPKEVELVFQVGLSDFNKINESDFNVVCDYRESNQNEIDYLIPKLINKPTMIKEVKIVPSKIEFLLEK